MEVKMNIQNEEGNTALHIASFNGYIEICKLLVEKGIEKNIRNKKGYTALHLASYNGKKEIS